MRERNGRMDVTENQVWPPLQEYPRQETDTSDDEDDEEHEDAQRDVQRPSQPPLRSMAGNLPMKYGLTFEEWKAKKATYQPPKRAHFSRRDVTNREVHARVAKVGVRKEPIPVQTRGRLRPAWDERFVLDEPTIERPGSKTMVVRRKDSYEHTMIPTSRPTTAPSTMSSPVYAEHIPTQTTHTHNSTTTQATNNRGTSPLPTSRQSIDSFQAPRFSLRTTNPVYRRTSRSTSPVYSPARKGEKYRNGFTNNGHHRTSYDHDNQENHHQNHHNQWDREDFRDHPGISHHHNKETNQEIHAREMIQSIVQGRERQSSPGPVVVVKDTTEEEDMVVEYTHGGKSILPYNNNYPERQ